MNNSPTTHSERVVGWIVLGLFGTIIVGMLLSAFAPNLSVSSQAQLLAIVAGSAGALAGSLTLRRPTQPTETQQQVTIPSSDPDIAPITVSSGTPVAPNPKETA